MSFERVYTVWDYFDGPRDGLADFRGSPHYYKCSWDNEADDYSSEYELFPIDSSLLGPALEQWQIFKRWEADFHSGLVGQETHPGVGGINPRYDALEAVLNSALEPLGPPAHRATAAFRAIPPIEPLAPGIMRELEVSWSTVA
jgi:hypothetical protein